MDNEILAEVVSFQETYPCPRCGRQMRDIGEAEAHADRCRGDGLAGLDEIPVLGEGDTQDEE